MSLSKEQLEYLKVAHPVSKTMLDPKQVLLDKLKLYRGILTGEKLEYLESLIELETSAVRSELFLDEQEALLDLGLYQDIVKYNIGHRAKKILESLYIPELKIALDSKGDAFATLYFDYEQESYHVFSYNSSCGFVVTTRSFRDGLWDYCICTTRGTGLLFAPAPNAGWDWALPGRGG